MKINWINGLNLKNIGGDIYGGLTAAVVALPLAMAMGVASGAGAISGIYGAIFVGFFASLFGGTPAQVSGPTGPMTVVMAAVFVQYTAMFPDNPAQGAALAFTVVVIGGIFQIIFGILRIGKYIEFVPHPVVSGFMTGIGVIIILLQIAPLLGQVGDAKPILAAQAIPDYLQNINISALVLGLLVLFIVYAVPYFFPKLARIIPSPLLALITGTIAYLLFLPVDSVAIIGDIPTGLPQFYFPVLHAELMLNMIVSGLTLASLGAIDSLLTSLVADNISRTQHKPDRELIGQGIGNMMAGLFGGLPGAGATMRTVVNVKAGGKTPLSGALHSIILLLIVLGAGALAADIPKAVLAGILIKVGTDIIDWDYLKRLKTAPIAGTVIMFAVLIITVAVDLLLAFGIGMVMASFLFMKRITDLQIESINATTKGGHEFGLTEQEISILDEAQGAILYIHLGSAMSFSSAKTLVRRHTAMSEYKLMILDLTLVPSIDFTFTRALEDIIEDTKKNDHEVIVIGASYRVTKSLADHDIMSDLYQAKVFKHRAEAFAQAKQLLLLKEG